MAVRLFDSHCHLDMKDFHGRVAEVLGNAYRAGVRRVLLAACDVQSSYEAIRLAREHTDSEIEIWAAAGVHPHDASSVARGLPEELTDLALNDRVVAIGEMGLDYYYDNSPRRIQAPVFEEQIEWARRAQKPIIVHLRNAERRSEGDAYADAIRIMKSCRAEDCGGVVHCFSGEKKDARAALDLGFYVSFAGPLTYPKAGDLREVAAYVPGDRILCETDSPYLAPQSRRGKRNEPANVREVYEKMAEVRGTGLEELSENIWHNADRLFGKNPQPSR